MAVTSMANSSIRDFTKFNNMATFFGASPFTANYVVVAGGGGGGSSDASGGHGGGGGGAGGYRANVPGESSGGGDSAESELVLSAGTYTVTVGAGGAGGLAAMARQALGQTLFLLLSLLLVVGVVVLRITKTHLAMGVLVAVVVRVVVARRAPALQGKVSLVGLVSRLHLIMTLAVAVVLVGWVKAHLVLITLEMAALVSLLPLLVLLFLALVGVGGQVRTLLVWELLVAETVRLELGTVRLER